MEKVSRGRSAVLRGGRSAASIVAKGALQLLISLTLSTVMYVALYVTLVPKDDARHKVQLHFGLCQKPRGHTTGLPARVAHVAFDASDTLQPGAATSAALLGEGSLVPPLARAYDYGVELCLRMPESPPNVEAGTFLASLRVASARNESLLAVDRAMVLRYRSERFRAMWSVAYSIPLLLGWMEEEQTHCTLLADAFTNPRHAPTARAVLALVSPLACQLQVYSATLQFRARLGGVTYAMTQYAFATAAVSIGALMLAHWVAMLLFELRGGGGGGEEGGGDQGGGRGQRGGRSDRSQARRRGGDAFDGGSTSTTSPGGGEYSGYDGSGYDFQGFVEAVEDDVEDADDDDEDDEDDGEEEVAAADGRGRRRQGFGASE